MHSLTSSPLTRLGINRRDKRKRVQSIQITDDPDRSLKHSPPSALDYAVILDSLHNRGYKEVILTTRMTWDQHPGLETQGLSSRLALFARSAIPLPVTRAATAQALPTPCSAPSFPCRAYRGTTG